MRYFLLIVLLLAGNAVAVELPAPKGDILLVVSGSIENTNSERGVEFDLEMLEQLTATTIRTASPWTDETTEFTGVRFDALLEFVGAQSSSVRAYALDNYWYDLTDVGFEKYPVVLAYKRDGDYMNARNLGPLWIMYPFDDFPELLNHANKASCVWQLNSLVVQ